MLLASYIGIAGSVIGVAVASIVSALAASAYKKFLRDSAEKIKELPLPVIHDGLTKPLQADDQAGDETGEEPEHVADNEPQKEATEKTDNHPHHDRKKIVRRLIIICVASALLAVAGTAIAVNTLTTGQGLGTKPEPIITLPVHRTENRATHDASDHPANTPHQPVNVTNQSAVNIDGATNTSNIVAPAEQPVENPASNSNGEQTDEPANNTAEPGQDGEPAGQEPTEPATPESPETPDQSDAVTSQNTSDASST